MHFTQGQDQNLLFITEKINSIRYALFKSEGNSDLQLPNNIIQAIKVDNDGSVWFFTSCSGEYASHVEKSFYASLDFYRKGTDCRLQLTGTATIVEDDEEFTTRKNLAGNSNQLLLVKMKILKAEYFENKHESVGTLKNKVKTLFQQLFVSAPHKKYSFS